MTVPVNSHTFDKMVDEDILWLKHQGVDLDDYLYGQHLLECLEMSKKYYREVYLPSLPEEDWNC